jgi:PKD repeat protein
MLACSAMAPPSRPHRTRFQGWLAVNANKLLALLVTGVPLAYAACGGDSLTLPSEGQPAHITVMPDRDGQSARVGAELPNSLVVKVTDTQDRPVAGAAVNFTLDDAAAGGLAQPASALTDANGLAGSSITLGTRVGLMTGHATVSVPAGTVPVTTAFTATAVSADANGITLVAGDGQSGQVGAALTNPLVVQVSDGFGNPIPNVRVQWSVTGGGSVSATETLTGTDGRASVTRTLGNTAGTQTTSATATGLAGSPVTFTHTAIAGNASRVEIVSGDGQNGTPGSQLSEELVVRVLDADNNPIAGRPVEWVIGEGGGSPNPDRSNTDDQGYARTRWTLGPTAGRNTLNAVVSGVGQGRVTFTATGGRIGSTTKITGEGNDPSTVGETVRIQFTVTGAGGTPTGTVNVTVSGGPETCSGTVASGFCDLTLTVAGNQRDITATYSGDGRYNTSSDTERHRVVPAPTNNAPTAAFEFNCERLVCTFDNRSQDSDGDALTFDWDFGDGTPHSQERDPSHAYAQAGSYNVKLIVRDSHNATDEAIVLVEPNNPPDAVDDSYTTPGLGQPLSVLAPGVLLNDSDPDLGATISASLKPGSGPSKGVLTLRSDGSFDYSPASPGPDTDTFVYTATDNKGAVDEATVTITIAP